MVEMAVEVDVENKVVDQAEVEAGEADLEVVLNDPTLR
jgi:hypothetical protein